MRPDLESIETRARTGWLKWDVPCCHDEQQCNDDWDAVMLYIAELELAAGRTHDPWLEYVEGVE